MQVKIMTRIHKQLIERRKVETHEMPGHTFLIDSSADLDITDRFNYNQLVHIRQRQSLKNPPPS